MTKETNSFWPNIDLTPYVNLKMNRSLEISDLSILDEWESKYLEGASCAIHPYGFPVFITPSEIIVDDEYQEYDPYRVEQNLDSEFHKRRINNTLYLIDNISKSSTINRILDIGCGEGYITSEVAKSFSNAKVYGVDYSLSAIEKASLRFENINFAVANAYNLPFQESYFDVVVCNNLWEHVPDPINLAKNISKILRPGGALIISTPSRYRIENMVRIILGKQVMFMSNQHVTEYSIGQVKEQLCYAGYLVIQTYSEVISQPTKGIKSFILYKLATPFMRTFLKLIGRSDSAESTIFYLARFK